MTNKIQIQADKNSCTITFAEAGAVYTTRPRVWHVLVMIAFHQKYPPCATQSEVITFLNSRGNRVSKATVAG